MADNVLDALRGVPNPKGRAIRYLDLAELDFADPACGHGLAVQVHQPHLHPGGGGAADRAGFGNGEFRRQE